MADLVLKEPYFAYNSNDLSSKVVSVTLRTGTRAPDNTAGGDLTELSIPGLKYVELEVEFKQDFAASAMDSILFALVGTAYTFELRAVNAAVSTSNPKFTGSAFIESYPILDAKVGDRVTTPVVFKNTTALTRATS